jgi:hypothetical protein
MFFENGFNRPSTALHIPQHPAADGQFPPRMPSI